MNNFIQIDLPEPYEAQRPVLKSIFDPRVKFVVLNGGRQVGKSLIVIISALYFANQKGNTIMIVSPTDGQVKKIQTDMLTIIGKAYKLLVKSHKMSAGDAQILFNSGSKILFRSAASEQNLRGNTNNILILDEFAFQKESTYLTILEPTLSKNCKKVIYSSTPNGQNNLFAKLYKQGLQQDSDIKSFKITYKDNPFADIDFIEGRRLTLPIEIFEQEYLGNFASSSSVLKNVEELSVLNRAIPSGQECVIGIDIAFKVDYTVAVCLSKTGDMLDYIRFNKEDGPAAVILLKEFINKWKPKHVILESNNQGLIVSQLLRQAGIHNIQDFYTSPESKKELINQMMSVFAHKEIKLLNDPIIKEEMQAFGYKISDSGNITFAALWGHDDIVMATALAIEAKKNLQSQQIFIRRG